MPNLSNSPPNLPTSFRRTVTVFKRVSEINFKTIFSKKNQAS